MQNAEVFLQNLKVFTHNMFVCSVIFVKAKPRAFLLGTLDCNIHCIYKIRVPCFVVTIKEYFHLIFYHSFNKLNKNHLHINKDQNQLWCHIYCVCNCGTPQERSACSRVEFSILIVKSRCDLYHVNGVLTK